MLENYIIQVRRPKGVLSEREAFVSQRKPAQRLVSIILNSIGVYFSGLYYTSNRE